MVDSAGNLWVVDQLNERISKGVIVRPVLTATWSGTQVIVSWTPSDGTLQSSTSVAGPYVDIPGATSPYTVAPGGPQTFYRIRL